MILRRHLLVALVALGLSVAAVAAMAAVAEMAATERRTEPGAARSSGSAKLEPGATLAELEAARREVLALVNEARRRAGREPLEPNAALELAATRHATDMLVRGYFAHEGPDGSTATERAASAGYPRARVLGETIAYGQRTADEVVAGWLASPPHRRILLDRRVTQSGIGVAVGTRERSPRITWVELVAVRAAPR